VTLPGRLPAPVQCLKLLLVAYCSDVAACSLQCHGHYFLYISRRLVASRLRRWSPATLRTLVSKSTQLPILAFHFILPVCPEASRPSVSFVETNKKRRKRISYITRNQCGAPGPVHDLTRAQLSQRKPTVAFVCYWQTNDIHICISHTGKLA